MKKFKIYPKDGEPFTVEFERFEFSGKQFVFYDSANDPSKEGFASFDKVAAIVPDPPIFPQTNQSYTLFCVYLQGHEDDNGEICIAAHKIDYEQEPSLIFYWEKFDLDSFTPVQIPNVYIATKEVVAIFPSGGLQTRR